VPRTKPKATGSIQLPYTQHKWEWRGHKINYATAGCGKPIILVHGFGLSSSHYRKTIAELSKGYKVYAVDLLGFGASSKPTTIQYCMDLWRDLLQDFMAEFTSGAEGGATLVGNSIGSLACLMAAANSPKDAVRGVVLLNTAGAMNNKGILSDWRIVLVYPLLLFIDFILSIPAFAQVLFSKFATKENIKEVLKSVYMNTEAVTDELVELIYAPSLDAGARDVFVSVITGPPGPKPWALVPDITCPILVLWGDKDTLTPADGPVGKYFQILPNSRPNTTFTFLPDVGHCIHDDRPEVVHAELVPWLDKLHK